MIQVWVLQVMEFFWRCTRNIFCSVSDQRLKTNITSLSSKESLNIISKFRGVTYNWSKDAIQYKKFPEKKIYGLIAQEVESVDQSLITQTNRHLDDSKNNILVENIKAINYNEITALLIESIKELKLENEHMRQRLDSLEH